MTALYDQYSPQGLEIVAFPCNQFGEQEFDTNAEIKAFATDEFGFKGLMMSVVDVNGPNADPVWVYLKEQVPGDGTPLKLKSAVACSVFELENSCLLLLFQDAGLATSL